jgi:hypothetical protein
MTKQSISHLDIVEPLSGGDEIVHTATLVFGVDRLDCYDIS